MTSGRKGIRTGNETICMRDNIYFQFVDTNLLVYAYDVTARQKRERARDLIRKLWDSGEGCLSIQVLQEFYVTVTRKVPHPLDSETASVIVDGLTHWTIHTPGAANVVAAIAIHRRNDVSFWDAMIIRSASVLGCGILWSEDLNDGQVYDGIRVANPFAENGR